jgi:hypothetical protein
VARAGGDLGHPTEHVLALGVPGGEDLHRVRPARRRTISQLSIYVVAPAADLATRQQRTRVAPTGGDLGHPVEHVLALGVPGGEDLHRVRPVRRRTISQLPICVVAPAADRAIRQQRTRATAAEGDLRHPTEHVLALGVPGGEDLHRIRPAIREAVPELTGAARAPAADRAIRQQRTRVGAAGGDLGHPTEHDRIRLGGSGRQDLHRVRPVVVVVPSPNRPSTFLPQQRTVPSDSSAHVWLPPATTCGVTLPPPDTGSTATAAGPPNDAAEVTVPALTGEGPIAAITERTATPRTTLRPTI